MENESDIALARLRAKLTGADLAIAHFTRTDGRKVTLTGVRVESIGPSAENPGVIGVEFDGSDRLVHIPFVESWEIEYV